MFVGRADALTSTSGAASLTVARAVLTVRADDKTRVRGAANPALSATFTGFVNGQSLATSGVTGSASVSTPATATSPAGAYAITAAVGNLAAGNYSFAFADGTLRVVELAAFAVGRGLVQRSFLRHVDVTLDGAAIAAAVANPSRVRLTRFALDGTGPGTPVGLAGVVSAAGATVSLDFSAGAGRQPQHERRGRLLRAAVRPRRRRHLRDGPAVLPALGRRERRPAGERRRRGADRRRLRPGLSPEPRRERRRRRERPRPAPRDPRGRPAARNRPPDRRLIRPHPHHPRTPMTTRFLLAAAVALALAADARAQFTITVGNATVTAGSAATLDVTISGGPERLDIFGAEFRITPVGGAAGRARFADPQSNAQTAAPNYVFFSDRLANPGSGSVTTAAFARDTYIGGDGTRSTEGALLTPANNLLVRLDVSAFDANPGEQFAVTLVPNANTFFNDRGFTAVDFTGTPGTISVVPVPEPAGLLAAAAALAVAARRWRFGTKR